jgi:hypothetical protein
MGTRSRTILARLRSLKLVFHPGPFGGVDVHLKMHPIAFQKKVDDVLPCAKPSVSPTVKISAPLGLSRMPGRRFFSEAPTTTI